MDCILHHDLEEEPPSHVEFLVSFRVRAVFVSVSVSSELLMMNNHLTRLTFQTHLIFSITTTITATTTTTFGSTSLSPIYLSRTSVRFLKLELICDPLVTSHEFPTDYTHMYSISVPKKTLPVHKEWKRRVRLIVRLSLHGD